MANRNSDDSEDFQTKGSGLNVEKYCNKHFERINKNIEINDFIVLADRNKTPPIIVFKVISANNETIKITQVSPYKDYELEFSISDLKKIAFKIK